MYNIKQLHENAEKSYLLTHLQSSKDVLMTRSGIAVFGFSLFIGFTGTAQAQNSFLDLAAKSFFGGKENPTVTAPSTSAAVAALSNSDIGAGLKEALLVGTDTVVKNIGKTNGFNLDPKIHIPLPASLQTVHKALSAVGMGGLTSDLETRLNRAAEAATPKAKELFKDSIRQMTLADAKQILSGPNDAATQYLKKTMSPGLAKEMQPVVKSALADAGAIKAYDTVMGKYNQLPLVSGVKENLNNYVVDQAMNGIFYYVAQEEAAIRQNPAKRTTDLLKKVFTATTAK